MSENPSEFFQRNCFNFCCSCNISLQGVGGRVLHLFEETKNSNGVRVTMDFQTLAGLETGVLLELITTIIGILHQRFRRIVQGAQIDFVDLELSERTASLECPDYSICCENSLRVHCRINRQQ